MKDHLQRNWKWYAAGAIGLGILAYAAKADAADLGGTCCADLEQRIAELEATTARKGNRKVSLVIAGQLNKALFYYDAKDVGLGSDTRVIENGASESFVTITGAGQIRPGWLAGYVLELGQGQTGIDINIAANGINGGVGTDNDIYTRQSYAFVRSDDLGTLSIGLQSMATDDLVHQNVARTDAASKRLTAHPIGHVSFSLVGIELLNVPLEPFNGRKANAVKYTSPTVSGFTASAAWNSEDDSWDAALRFAGEGGGFTVVGAIGYYDDKTNDIAEEIETLTGPLGISSKTITINAGVKHNVSGLFAQGTWARLDVNSQLTSFTTDAWHVQAGWEGKVIDAGPLTIWGEYAEWSDLADLRAYGIGLNQNLNDAFDLYAIAKRYEIGSVEIDTLTGGLRVRF